MLLVVEIPQIYIRTNFETVFDTAFGPARTGYENKILFNITLAPSV